MKCRLMFLFVILAFIKTEAQFYNTGSSPGSTKWNQIKSEKFQIIYSSQSEIDAQRLANTLEITKLHTASAINSTIRKPIKIVLHNQSVLSNGYVVWAPRRMELVPTPSQNSYAQNWIDQLALHEYRHVAQIEKLNTGFTRGLSYLIGDLAQGATVGLLPLWFLEGDAVVNETALSFSGRGREPSFNQGLKAIELEKRKRLTYDQVYLGTYRTNAPNHYEFGYQMVAWMKANHNDTIWGNTIDNVARQSFTFIPFYRGLKKGANLSKTKLYNNTFDDLGAQWKQESIKIIPNSSVGLETRFKSKFVSYRFPYQFKDNSIVAIRTSIDDIAKLVELRNGKEKTLKVLGSYYGSQVTYSEKYIAWEELRFDPRWSQRNYSVIRIYDREKEETFLLRKKERQFSPSINPSNNKIAVQKLTLSNQSILELYDIKSKLLIKKYEHPEKAFLTFNDWINDSLIAMVVTGTNGQKSIQTINTNSGNWDTIFAETYNNISNLKATENRVYFTYTKDGRQNIYSLNISNEKVLRATNSKIGADFASVSVENENLMYSEYTSNGYKIKSTPIVENNYKDINDIPKYQYPLANSLSHKAKFNIQDTVFEKKQYETSKYPKMLNTINIHSWLLPLYVDIDELSADVTSLQENTYLGATLLSQNVLSTVTTSLGYYYKDGYHYFKPSMYVTALYPVISLDMKFGGPTKIYSAGARVTKIPEGFKNGQEYNLKISQPLNFSTSGYSSAFTPAIRMVYENSYVVDSVNNPQQEATYIEDQLYYYKDRLYSEAILSFYLTSKLSYKDIHPKWGVSAYYSHLNPITNKSYFSKNSVLLNSVYLPGFLRHNSILIKTGIERGRGSRLSPPRGYLASELYPRETSNSVSINYALPVLYPDISAGPVAYLKRIHANFFWDAMDYHTKFYIGNIKYEGDFQLYSAGVELGFEMNFLRFFYPITPTIRYAYLENTGDSRISFFINTSFSFGSGFRSNSIANPH